MAGGKQGDVVLIAVPASVKRTNHAATARRHMKALDVYKKEFEPVIKIYAQLRDQYDVLTAQFVASGFDYSEETAQGSKKHPIVTTLESLRKDILTYASQLGLTPTGLKRINDASLQPAKTSPLAKALLELSG